MVRNTTRLDLMIGLCAAVWLAAGTAPAAAQGDREGRWQFYLPVTYVSGDTVDGGGGSTFDVNDDWGWGFGVGYNLNERLMLGFEITWLTAHYRADIEVDNNGNMRPDDTVSLGGTLDASNLQFVGQFNFLESPFTPFIRGNVGSTYVDSNIPSGPTQGVCWWDPWWGYICDTWRPTFDTNELSYGGAIGVRGDVGNAFFLELSYNQLWIDFDADTPSFDGVRLNLGWMF